jgi:hypothetical protein
MHLKMSTLLARIPSSFHATRNHAMTTAMTRGTASGMARPPYSATRRRRLELSVFSRLGPPLLVAAAGAVIRRVYARERARSLVLHER